MSPPARNHTTSPALSWESPALTQPGSFAPHLFDESQGGTHRSAQLLLLVAVGFDDDVVEAVSAGALQASEEQQFAGLVTPKRTVTSDLTLWFVVDLGNGVFDVVDVDGVARCDGGGPVLDVDEFGSGNVWGVAD